ncbi:MAG: hypothetical protein ABI585_01830 [Betaproteobacteria bacterium]
MDIQRFDKTTKGRDEIALGQKNLRGKLRTVLFLVDAGKDVGAIQQQIALLGAPPDAIAQLASGGYIAAAGSAAVRTEAQGGAGTSVESFRIAKAFMNDTIVDARGIRAFVFTLKLERCATQADLATLVPDYTEALLKSLGREAVRLLVDRTRELIAH